MRLGRNFGAIAVLAVGMMTSAFGQSVWTTQYSSTTKFVSAIDFVNTKIGWAVGSGGLILKSKNGGNSWVQESSGTSLQLISVQFLDTNTGWAVGDSGKILNTNNGGLTWIFQNSGVSGSPDNKNLDIGLNSVHFVDKLHGWIAGQYDVVLKTVNGGISWSQQIQVANGAVGWPSIYFVDTNSGWVVGSDNGSGIINRTKDGGATWSQYNVSPIPILYSTFFVNDSDGWAVGTPVNFTNPGILKTTDGGNTWNYQSGVNQSSLWRSIFFSDVNHGWIVGDSGVVLKTSNAGNSWSYLNIGTSLNLQSINFTDTNTGWVVGCNNTSCSILSSQQSSSNKNSSTITGFVCELPVIAASISVTPPQCIKIQNATVSLYGGVLAKPVSVKTDTTGRFVFDSVVADSGYNLMFTANGYQSNTLGNVNVPQDSVISLGDISLEPTSSIEPYSPSKNLLSLHLSSSRLSFTLPNSFSNSTSSATIYTLSGNKLLNALISSKSDFSMSIVNLGEGEYILEVNDSKNKITEPFNLKR